MTLIFGARCVDGVVLVGDRLVKSGRTVSFTMDKIRKFGNINWAVAGAAGIGTLFDEFLTLLPEYVIRHQQWINYQNAKLEHDREETFGNTPNAPEPPYYTYSVEDFKHNCAELMADMRKRYSFAFENPNKWCELQVLIGINTLSEAKLYYMDSESILPAEVPESVFIGQEDMCEVFRKCWNQSMTIKQAAQLGAFTIKYVELDKISDTVGVGVNQPQIWYIPDGSDPRELVGLELSTLIQQVDREKDLVYRKLHSLFRS